MTVRELIEKLATFPPDARVIVTGYEGGFDDVDTVEPRPIMVDYYDPDEQWYMGPHSTPDATKDERAEEVAIWIAL